MAELGPHRIFCADLQAAGLPIAEAEYVFHPRRRFRFDKAWPDFRVALEINGGVFGIGPVCPACGQNKRGAHQSVKGRLRDMEKMNEAAGLGWLVLYCTPDGLHRKTTLDYVRTALTERGWRPEEKAPGRHALEETSTPHDVPPCWAGGERVGE